LASGVRVTVQPRASNWLTARALAFAGLRTRYIELFYDQAESILRLAIGHRMRSAPSTRIHSSRGKRMRNPQSGNRGAAHL